MNREDWIDAAKRAFSGVGSGWWGDSAISTWLMFKTMHDCYLGFEAANTFNACFTGPEESMWFILLCGEAYNA